MRGREQVGIGAFLRVFSNTAASVDGKIGTVRHDHVAVGSAADRRWMSELRARADAVLVGGRTFRNWPLPLIEVREHGAAAGARWHPERRAPIINAVLTRTGLLDCRPRPSNWPAPGVELLVFGGEDIDTDAHRSRWGAEVLCCAAPDVTWALDVLAARGCREVLVEGGGDLIFQLLQADLLDELFVTVCPKIIGGSAAPSPVDGEGFLPGGFPALRLLDLHRVGDEIYLQYAVERASRC